MMKNMLRTGISLIAVLLLSSSVLAEDIDLFAGITPGGANPPTVLLGWHSSANSNANVVHGCLYADDLGVPNLGSTVGGMEQCAMVNTMLSLLEPENDYLLGAIKIGLMVFNQNSFSSFDNGTTLGNGDNRCGFLLVPPVLMDEAGINDFIRLLKSMDKSDLGNQTRLGDLIAESWAMLNGLPTSCSGVDYSQLAESATDCRDAVLVYIGNATKETANVKDGTGNPDVLLKAQLTDKFGYSTSSEQYNFFATPRAVTQLNNSDASNNSYWGDEWTRFMNLVDTSDSSQSDRNITTYSIAVFDSALEAKLAGEINFLADLALEGGGKAFKVTAANHAGLQAIFLQIFNEVQDVNSAFSSATLPVSANTQGTFLNQVYIANFRPDGDAAPRWNGNVKQYQLGFDAGGNIVLADADQDVSGVVESAINPLTGSIEPLARSFWTTNAPKDSSGTLVSAWPSDGFWRNSPEGQAFKKDAPDGELVEKGGVGQILRVDNLLSSDQRRVYTCNATGSCPTGGAALNAFSTDNTTLVNNFTTLLGAGTAGGAASLSGGDYEPAMDLSTSCSGSGNGRSCVITHDGTMVINAASDKMIVNGAWNDSLNTNKQVCTSSTPCTVSNVTANSFTVNSKDIPSGASYTGIEVLRVTNKLTVTQSAHSLTQGDAVTLDNCTASSTTNTYNLASVTGEVLGSVASIESANSFAMTIGNDVMIEGAGISCGSSVETLSAANLIDWVRGDDIVGNESRRGPCPPESRDSDCPISVRGSIHADVLHSRPAVINYGGSTGVVLFYGSNDGHFHAVNGNQQSNVGSVQPGGELWSFVAPEFFPKLKRQFNNSPLVSYPNVTDPDAEPRDYFFDGNTTVLQDKRSSSPTAGKSYIYMSARRGGRFIYALDVTTPTSPKFLWRISEAEIPELGQTWSQAQIALIKGYANPVLVLGAGYDPAQDAEPAPASDTQGRGIIILDSVTGGVVWAGLKSCSGVTTVSGGHCLAVSDMNHSIPASITLLDRDLDGYIERLYANDVGGNIWRVDLEPVSSTSPAFSDVAVTKLASLGGTGNNARKFLFPPDVIPTGNFDAVVAVSGDREHPLYTADTTPGLSFNVQNRFFMVMDKNLGKSVPASYTTVTMSDLVDQSVLQCADAGGSAVDCASADSVGALYFDGQSSTIAGYYFDLLPGEKGVNAPLTVAGKVYFGTNQPDVPASGSCTANLGNAGAYIVSLVTGERQRNEFVGGGLPPSPIAGLVDIDGKTVPFIIGGTGPSPFTPSTPALDLSGARKRTYWYYK